MKVQCVSAYNNTNFCASKLKNGKIKHSIPNRENTHKNIENIISLVGWGVLFGGLLYGVTGGVKNFSGRLMKTDEEKYILTDEEYAKRMNDTAECDSACQALKNNIDEYGIDWIISNW